MELCLSEQTKQCYIFYADQNISNRTKILVSKEAYLKQIMTFNFLKLKTIS